MAASSLVGDLLKNQESSGKLIAGKSSHDLPKGDP